MSGVCAASTFGLSLASQLLQLHSGPVSGPNYIRAFWRHSSEPMADVAAKLAELVAF